MLVVVLALGQPRGVDAVDAFDALGALLACGLAATACWVLPAWTTAASIVFVSALALHFADSCNRVEGFPDKETWWTLQLLWVPLIGFALWRRMRLALAMVPIILVTSWLAFAARLAAYPVGPLAALDWKDALARPEPRATAKATGGRVWVYSCVGQLQAVAVYRASEDASHALSPLRPLRAERLESVNAMPTGSGSMDHQTPNVPLPFGRLVRCP
jgi:hypothetical protein